MCILEHPAQNALLTCFVGSGDWSEVDKNNDMFLASSIFSVTFDLCLSNAFIDLTLLCCLDQVFHQYEGVPSFSAFLSFPGPVGIMTMMVAKSLGVNQVLMTGERVL